MENKTNIQPVPTRFHKNLFKDLRNRTYMIIFIIIFALIGVYLIVQSFASSPTTQVWNTDASWNTGILSNVAVSNNNVTLASSAPTTSQADLALNKPAVASSIQPQSTLVASNVDDGSLSTRWGSQFSDPQWIYVDLGSQYSINEVRLNWETAYGKAYQIQVSNDATTWTTIYSTTSGTGGVNDLKGLSGTGR